MPLSMRSTNRTVELKHENLFLKFKQFNIKYPFWEIIERDYYSDPKIKSKGQIESLVQELELLKEAISEETLIKKSIYTKNLAVKNQILAELLSTDELYLQIEAIVLLLKDAISTNQEVVCESD